MNITAVLIVAIVCWAIVKLVNGPKGKKKDKKEADQINLANSLERDMAVMRERIETLEKIVTDEKYDLNRQFDDLKTDKVA
ncbi:MAG: phage shock protein B [Paraglaciecola sp.]|jgi:phage shock protein B